MPDIDLTPRIDVLEFGMDHPIVIRDENEHWDVMDPEDVEVWFEETMERRRREVEKDKLMEKRRSDDEPELALGA